MSHFFVRIDNLVGTHSRRPKHQQPWLVGWGEGFWVTRNVFYVHGTLEFRVGGMDELNDEFNEKCGKRSDGQRPQNCTNAFVLYLLAFHRENPPFRNGLTPIGRMDKVGWLGLDTNAMWVAAESQHTNIYYNASDASSPFFLLYIPFDEYRETMPTDPPGSGHETRPRGHTTHQFDKHAPPPQQPVKNHVHMSSCWRWRRPMDMAAKTFLFDLNVRFPFHSNRETEAYQ